MSAFLWHFCCRHSAKAIGRYGLVRPMVGHPFLGGARLVWFTTDRRPKREAVGLTMETIRCDRMECCYEVTDAHGCEPFNDWIRDRDHLHESANYWLMGPDQRPETWWVSESAVPVRRIA